MGMNMSNSIGNSVSNRLSKKILAVDDSGSLRQMLTFSLRSGGYQVIDAVDVETLGMACFGFPGPNYLCSSSQLGNSHHVRKLPFVPIPKNGHLL